MASSIQDGSDPRGNPGESLLATHDPRPARVINPGGASSFLLIGDHAGKAIPARLGPLGVSETDLARHIGWDIGVAGLGEALARKLDAVFVRQTYSRLVIDCNRDPAAIDAMPMVSDGTEIPGNAALSDADRAARVAAIHEPYQAAIAAELARRDAGGRESVLISLHSFTPRMRGFDRPWQVGILHNGANVGFALRVLAALGREPGLTVGDNQPYQMDGIDYTVPRHAFGAGRAYVEFEVRQDLLATPEQQAEWAARLARVLRAVAAEG